MLPGDRKDISIKNDPHHADNSAEFMKKQLEFKAYYDNFRDNDGTSETKLQLEAAEKFTQSLLAKVPSGNVNDKDILCHILFSLFKKQNEQCLFYDSAHGIIKLHDASTNLADISNQERPFVLTLKNSNGLGKRNSDQNEKTDMEVVQTLTMYLENKIPHPVTEYILVLLSAAHGVSKSRIVIKKIHLGSINVVYTVRDLTNDEMIRLQGLQNTLRDEFQEFVNLKIHPLLYRPSFDISSFDARGDKSFGNQPRTFHVGPSGRTKLYTTATEWTRYGLKVLGKYPTDKWLHPFQDPENWYRAYHGTGNAESEDFLDSNAFYDSDHASVDACSSIYTHGFRSARKQVHGEGVYCSPNPKYPEVNGYVCTVTLETQQGRKSFKCMLQVAVNPDGLRCPNDNIWVASPENMRVYGILIKEVNQNSRA